MLTKEDFDQIRKIIREEVENESQSIKDELGAEITLSRIRIQKDVEELKDRIKNLEIRVTKMHKELKEEIKMVTHFLDKENIKTLKRVKKIEDHFNLPRTS
jgi:hypothetical protein